MDSTFDICIIGGGLTGLTVAYYLRDQDLKVIILEARGRLGGRIETVVTQDGTPIEMGATWLGRKHEDLVVLAEELGVDIIPQFMGDKAIYEPISTAPHMVVDLPPNDAPSFRFKSGSTHLIDTLKANVKCDIHLNETVEQITSESNLISIRTINRKIRCRRVVSTLPPYLLKETILFSPRLPDHLLDVMNQTHTWMGESIKVGITYEHPFWLDKETSGTIVSNVGPIPEMYDHTNHEGKKYALKGFLQGNYAVLPQPERKELVLRQLRKYYGDQVDNYIAYVDRVWREEKFTHSDYTSHVLPHQYNGDSNYAKTFMDGKLWIAGSETALDYPGYMNGAVSSAKRVYHQIITSL